MKKSLLYLIVVIAIQIITIQTGNCKILTVIGEGQTRQLAINNGLRTAIEEGLGALINSESRVENGILIYDKINSASSGYIKQYTVVAEGKDPISEIYKVKLNVELDDIKLKNTLAQFMDDPRFQRIFQETKFNERKVIILYMPSTNFDLPYNSKAVQSVMNLIQDQLVDRGFRIFLPEQLNRIKKNILYNIKDENTALNIARQELGDAVVLVSFNAGENLANDNYYLVYASLTLKAYDCTTGEVFASVQDRGKTITRGNQYNLQDGIARIAIKIAPRLVDRLVSKIVSRFSGNRANFITLIIKNTNLSQMDQVENMLERMGWRYRVSKQANNYMELELFTEADPTSARSILRKQFKQNNISLRPIELSGSRIIFEQ